MNKSDWIFLSIIWLMVFSCLTVVLVKLPKEVEEVYKIEEI